MQMIYSYAFPGNIEDDILNIAAQQIPYMRTEWFSELMKESQDMLLDFIGCREGRVLFFTASGTGAMDAVVENYIGDTGKALIIDGGTFGHRWVQMCEYHGVEYSVFGVPFAKDIDYTALEDMVRREKPVYLLCQHHETSSGQLFDISCISDICRRNGVSLVVDVISSFLAEEMDMDKLGVDVAITSTQKGLNLPPGAALVFLSRKALRHDFVHSNFYFDFQDYIENMKRGQTPFSPATTIFMQINERMKRNKEIGLDNIIARCRSKALYFREKCRQYGWEIPAENPSNAITGFIVRRNGDILFRELQKKNIFIMPSWRKDFFRVSHMGIQGQKELDMLTDAIRKIEVI